MRKVLLLCRRLFIAVLAIAPLTACSGPGGASEWDALPAAPAPAQLEQLAPVWDNGRVDANVDVRIYLEVYCREPACLDYLRESVPTLTGAPDARCAPRSPGAAEAWPS